MFFNEDLANDGILGPVWRAGNSIGEVPDETPSLPINSRNLDQMINSESYNVRRRLSLRTSAVLVHGAAKIHRKKMDQLLKDVAKLDEDMVGRNRREPTNIEEDASITSSGSLDSPEQMMRRAETQPDASITSSGSLDTPEQMMRLAEIQPDASITSSGSLDTPEQMMRLAEIQPDISFDAPTRNPTISPPTLRRYSFITSTPSPSKRQKTDIIDNGSKRSTKSSDRVLSESNQETPVRNERSESSPTFTETHQNNTRTDTNNTESDISSVRRNAEKRSDVRVGIESDRSNEGTRSIILQTTEKSQPKLRRKRTATRHNKIMKDQATQCDSFCPRTDERDDNTFDKSLPFGCLLIYDTYQSRVPSKIVFSSLKEDVVNNI